MLSNLLQELTLAQDYGRKQIILDEARLNENPVDRLARMIRDSFWHNLTRRIDGGNIAMVARDPKDWTADPRPRVYIPRGAPEQFEFYTRVAQKYPDIRLDVQWLSARQAVHRARWSIQRAVRLGQLHGIAWSAASRSSGNLQVHGREFLLLCSALWKNSQCQPVVLPGPITAAVLDRYDTESI